MSVGRIDGGTSVNTVPDRCQVEIDRRLIPGEDGHAALADLQAFLWQRIPSGIQWDCSSPWLTMPALPPQAGSDVARRLGQAIDSVRGSHVPGGEVAHPGLQLQESGLHRKGHHRSVDRHAGQQSEVSRVFVYL